MTKDATKKRRQTGATAGDTGGVERAVYQTRAENYPREDGSAAHGPPEGRAGYRTGVEETDSGDRFVYLGGAVCGDGKTKREVRRRVQAGWNTWRAVEGVVADRRISKRLNSKTMSTCVTLGCLYGTETLA